MPNVIVTKICNLQCPYCFIRFDKEKQMMSYENFYKVAAFLKENNCRRIGLCGGEPTIHPDFRKMLLLSYANFDWVHIYTNGININKFFDVIVRDKTTVLINVNNPDLMGIENYGKMRRNLGKLVNMLGNMPITLGVNLFTDDIDYYNYIFPVLEAYKMNKLRLSVCVPNNDDDKDCNSLEYFKSRYTLIRDFIVKCFNHGLLIWFDCNYPPTCLFSEEDIRKFESYGTLLNQSGILTTQSCLHQVAPIDILPDLQVSRCFGVKEYKAKYLSEFKNLDEIYDHFEKEIEIPASKIMPAEKCWNCENRKLHDCIAGCFSYKLKELKAIESN